MTVRFVKIGDEEINIGLIKLITFDPRWVPDEADPLVQRWMNGEIVELNDMKQVPLPRVWVTFEGRKDRIEVGDPGRIAVLKKLWEERSVL